MLGQLAELGQGFASSVAQTFTRQPVAEGFTPCDFHFEFWGHRYRCKDSIDSGGKVIKFGECSLVPEDCDETEEYEPIAEEPPPARDPASNPSAGYIKWRDPRLHFYRDGLSVVYYNFSRREEEGYRLIQEVWRSALRTLPVWFQEYML